MKTNQHYFAFIIERLSALYKADISFRKSIANYPIAKMAENIRIRNQRNLLSLPSEFSLSSHLPISAQVLYKLQNLQFVSLLLQQYYL